MHHTIRLGRASFLLIVSCGKTRSPLMTCPIRETCGSPVLGCWLMLMTRRFSPLPRA
uniref:Uncharacterized protein n=1 Tax=Arundo donax TaxID=35708 RepID=A0A0A8ZW10_ARUDO